MTEVTRSALAAHPFLRGMPSGHLDALAEVGADVFSRPGTGSSRTAGSQASSG